MLRQQYSYATGAQNPRLLPSNLRQGGTKKLLVVEINIAETPVSAQADFSLRGPAAEILPQLVS